MGPRTAIYCVVGVVSLVCAGIISFQSCLAGSRNVSNQRDVTSIDPSTASDALASLLSREFLFERKGVRIAKADWQRVMNVLPTAAEETRGVGGPLLGNPGFENLGPYIFDSPKKPVKDFSLEEAMLCFGWYEVIDGRDVLLNPLIALLHEVAHYYRAYGKEPTSMSDLVEFRDYRFSTVANKYFSSTQAELVDRYRGLISPVSNRILQLAGPDFSRGNVYVRVVGDERLKQKFRFAFEGISDEPLYPVYLYVRIYGEDSMLSEGITPVLFKRKMDRNAYAQQHVHEAHGD